jgi:hypothetical protein
MSQPYGHDPHGYQQQQPYPPQHGYGPPPGYVPPPPHRRRKKSSAPLVLGILGVVALVLFGGCAVLVVAASNAGNGTGRPARTAAAAATAKVGQQVADGDMVFTVTKVEERRRVGSGSLGEDAQGVFKLVHVRVRNGGSDTEAFSSSRQTLYDHSGREFEADASAAIYLRDSNSLYEKINPGNTVQGVLIFDVPASATGLVVELHSSIFSRGVKVRLPG